LCCPTDLSEGAGDLKPPQLAACGILRSAASTNFAIAPGSGSLDSGVGFSFFLATCLDFSGSLQYRLPAPDRRLFLAWPVPIWWWYAFGPLLVDEHRWTVMASLSARHYGLVSCSFPRLILFPPFLTCAWLGQGEA